MQWPDLPKDLLGNRAGTPDDVTAGRAVFVLRDEDEKLIGVPLPLDLPQDAYFVDVESGEKTPGIVIQAEEANGQQIMGMVGFDGVPVAGMVTDFELLGSVPPGAP